MKLENIVIWLYCDHARHFHILISTILVAMASDIYVHKLYISLLWQEIDSKYKKKSLYVWIMRLLSKCLNTIHETGNRWDNVDHAHHLFCL